MTLDLRKTNGIYKKLFTIKPAQRNGFIINLSHRNARSQKIRFINGCFNRTGQLLALIDNEDNVFIVNFHDYKFWHVCGLETVCTAIKFSDFADTDLLLGAYEGPVKVLNVETGLVSEELIGHAAPVLSISFAPELVVLTASKCEAIIWDFTTFSKVHVLRLNDSCTLKYISFIPSIRDIVTVFNDDFIQIWQFGTFEIKTQIQPLVWYNHDVKCATFTRDGKVMVLGCRPNHLALFLLANFKLLKFITLPEHIQNIKSLEFIFQINDGGANTILSILASRGIIYFYDIEKNIILSELKATLEICKFRILRNGILMACILCSGEVNVFDISQYIGGSLKTTVARVTPRDKRKKVEKCLEKVGIVKKQIRAMLEIEKLRIILKNCGEYPEAYRGKIWEHLLILPNNKDEYNAVINHRMIISFEGLCRKYSLENRRNLKNLKQLLDNLVTWCPFLLNVDYLPLFVFPFVKIFHNKPLICFEAVCTIILNWCQFWFEYFPLPPLNILSIIENILMEHDSKLLRFLREKGISADLYAWLILRTAFSEVLTASGWIQFWDHVITNEPSFLLCAVVAYNILQKSMIFTLKESKHFECFYNTHHPIDVRKLIEKTYFILANTNQSIHPRQYLNMFKSIKSREYPCLSDYPKTIIEPKLQEREHLKDEMRELQEEEMKIFKKRLLELDNLQNVGLEDEEKSRKLALENAIKKKILEEQERVQHFYERLVAVRQKFRDEDATLLPIIQNIKKMHAIQHETKYLESVLHDTQFNSRKKSYEHAKEEDKLMFHYFELLKNKNMMEQLFEATDVATNTKMKDLCNKQEDLSPTIETLKPNTTSTEYLKRLNLATSLKAINSLIKKIEDEVLYHKRGLVSRSDANDRFCQLQQETKELVFEVDDLIKMLADLKIMDSNGG